ncbi:hypothetical protein PENSPDRAFT_755194 [Peniophora sp. CONT]|nr:hypothetical protein PENSPDRAFT_755194 [Peniophora sp. CONT]
MGRAAKLCKRPKKAPTPAQGSSKIPTSAPSSKSKIKAPESAVELARKQAGLKAKAAAYKRKPGSEGPVLGGADYVGAMFGGRRRARVEAEKMPLDEE